MMMLYLEYPTTKRRTACISTTEWLLESISIRAAGRPTNAATVPKLSTYALSL